MSSKEELSRLEETLVSKLNEVRDIMDKQKSDLEVSIRRDLVAVQLKDILESHTSFYSLKNALEEYIKDLYQNVQVIKESDKDDENNKQE